MKTTLEKLIQIWELSDNSKYTVAKADEVYLKKYLDGNFKPKCDEKKLIFNNLVPLPWWGNIENPKVIVLVLNPSFNHENEQDEQTKCNHQLLSNLKNNKTINWLDDQISNDSVSKKWWNNTFEDIMKHGISANDIYEKVGVFELLGYYSERFPTGYGSLERLLEKEFGVENDEILPTQKALFEHLDYLIKDPERLVVIIWGQKIWRAMIKSLNQRDYIDTIHTRSHRLSEDNLRGIDFKRIVETLGGKTNL